MSLTNLEIVWIMSWCNLYHTCTKLFVYILISNNWNLAIHKWKHNSLANNICISLIIRIYSNSCISKHCLWTSSCELYISARLTYYLIFHMPEMPSLLLMYNLSIRNRSLTYWTPVNDSVALINIAFVVKLNEYFLYCLRTTFIHCETFSLPVCR